MVADRRSERGQSSVELAVAAAVIVPLMLLIPTMANLLSVQTEAHKAGRYIAWERTAYPVTAMKDNVELSDEVEQRFMRYPESGFGGSSVDREKLWRDFGSAGTPSIVDLESDNPNRDHIAIASDAPESSTSGFRNASARLAGVGGRYGQENAIQLRTQENTRLSIPISSRISLLNPDKNSSNALEAPEDPIAGRNRFYVSSSTALVADSWVPANEYMFFARVSDLTTPTRAGLRLVEMPFAGILNVAGFEEIDRRLFRGEAASAAFEMVGDQQSVTLPPRLTEY